MSLEMSAAEVLAALRSSSRVLLTSHRGPDGDAVGSLVGMRAVVEHLGVPVSVHIATRDLPLADELGCYDLGTLAPDPPMLDGATVVFLDCGNETRSALGDRLGEMSAVINVDHHHDNTRFGTIDHVVPASSTAELVWDLGRRSGLEPDVATAEALYVGLLTDTGRFGYENTTPRAHRMAADLLERGVDPSAVRRRLYEDVSEARLQLLRHALQTYELRGGGAVVLVRITAADFADAGADSADAEGIIDVLRGLRGVRVAASARELPSRPGCFKVSLRAADARVDVSRIARAAGGGGHPQAAGFETDLADEALASFLLDELAAQDAAVGAG